MNHCHLILLYLATYLVHCYCSVINCEELHHLNSTEKQPVYLMVLLPFSEYSSCSSTSPWIRGEDIQPAMELAKHQINNCSSLLQNYSMELIFVKDGCQNISETAYNLVKEGFSPGRPRITGIIGLFSEFAASIGKELDIATLQVGDRDTFQSNSKLLFGPLFSSNLLLNALVNLIEEAKWTIISVLIDADNIFYRKLGTAFTRLKQADNINITYFSVLPGSVLNELSAKSTFSKAIVVFAPEKVFKSILCLPLQQPLLHYQWVYVGPVSIEFTVSMQINFRGKTLKCSKEFYKSALDMTLLIRPTFSEPRNGTELSVMTSVDNYLQWYAEHREVYNRRVGLNNPQSTYSDFSKYFYDSVWAWSLALERTNNTVNALASYSSREHSQQIFHSLNRLKFEGMSGKFIINNMNSTALKVVVSQFCGGEWKSRNITRTNENGCELTPLQSFAVSLEPVEIFFLAYTSVQTLLLIVLQLFTVVFSEEPSVKSVDRMFLHVSFFGAYVFHVGVVIDMLDKVYINFYFIKLLLNVLNGVWVLPIGVTFLLSSVVARSWRVYRLFIHTFHPGKCLTSNRFLLGLILSFLVVDLILAVMTTSLIFYIHYGTTYHISLSAFIFLFFGIFILIKIGIFLVLCTLTLLTEKVNKETFSTRLNYFIVSLNILLLGVTICNVFVWKIYYSVPLALLLEVIIYILFVFLPPLMPILKSWIFQKPKSSKRPRTVRRANTNRQSTHASLRNFDRFSNPNMFKNQNSFIKSSHRTSCSH